MVFQNECKLVFSGGSLLGGSQGGQGQLNGGGGATGGQLGFGMNLFGGGQMGFGGMKGMGNGASLLGGLGGNSRFNSN